MRAPEKFPKPPLGYQINRVGNSLFFYETNAITPTFIFKRRDESSSWKGHGKAFRSISEARDWVASRII